MDDHHYRFYIGGYSIPLLYHLSAHNPSPDLAFINDEHDGGAPHFSFTSPHLDELNNLAHVWGRANQLLDMFHGIHVLATLSLNPLVLTARPRLHDLYDLWKKRWLDPTIAEPPSQFPYTAAVLAEPVNPVYGHNTMGRALLLARTQQDVLTLLMQLGQRLDWRTLYAILDTLRYYAGDDFDNCLQRANISNKQYKLLTHTANSFPALGLQARHGPTNMQPPAEPMPLQEAEYLIMLLSRQYLTDQHGIIFPEPIVYENDWGLSEDF